MMNDKGLLSNRMNVVPILCLLVLFVPSDNVLMIGAVLYVWSVWLMARQTTETESERLKSSGRILMFTAVSLLIVSFTFYTPPGEGERAALAIFMMVLAQFAIGLRYLFRPYISLPIVLGWLVAFAIGGTGIIEALHK